MKLHYCAQDRAVITLSHPLRDWAFRIAGLCLFLGVFALGAYLEDVDDTEPPEVAYSRGVAEGRQQMLLAYAERNRQAYSAGLDEGFLRCASFGVRK